MGAEDAYLNGPFAGLAPLIPEPTPSAFQAWLKTAAPGSEYVYASGVVWLDERQKNNSKIYLLDEATRQVAREAWGEYELGKVELCQRRNGNGFDYLCQKRRDNVRPFQPPILRGDVRKG